MTQNDAGTCSPEWHKSDTACSPDVPPDKAKETPAALAGATGANIQSSPDWLDDTLKRVDAASALSAAVLACHPDDREPLLEAALAHLRAGWPLPALFSVMAEAEAWADCASRAERKAYALASFRRLSPGDRNAFLNHIRTEVTA